MQRQLSLPLSHPQTLDSSAAPEEKLNPPVTAADHSGGSLQMWRQRVLFTADNTGHNPRQHHTRGKPENVSPPSRPITMLTVRVAATCSYIFGEVHVRVWRRVQCRLQRRVHRRLQRRTCAYAEVML